MKRREVDALPEHLAERPDFDHADYPGWWARRKALAAARGESVALCIIEERLRRARHRAGRSS